MGPIYGALWPIFENACMESLFTLLFSVYILFFGDFCLYNTLYDYVRMKITSNIDVCKENTIVFNSIEKILEICY